MQIRVRGCFAGLVWVSQVVRVLVVLVLVVRVSVVLVCVFN